MKVAALVLVETAHQGNMGAAMRIAANFGVPRILFVRPLVDPEDPEVADWACGAGKYLSWEIFESLEEALRPFRTVVGTASGRGRPGHPLLEPGEAGAQIAARGAEETALVFGNETRGLCREDLDCCDYVVRIPTEESFPVLNLVQAIAVLLGFLSFGVDEAVLPRKEIPAPNSRVEALMEHLERSLMDIGYLDPANPARIMRKLRRIIGRAAVSENEVAILRGICRQIDWAARTAPMAGGTRKPGRYEQSGNREG